MKKAEGFTNKRVIHITMIKYDQIKNIKYLLYIWLRSIAENQFSCAPISIYLLCLT